jgi:hypothetical protein
LIYFAAAVLLVKYIARRNYLAYLAIAWTLSLLDKGGDLLAQPSGFAPAGRHPDRVLAATLAWALAPVFRGDGRPA